MIDTNNDTAVSFGVHRRHKTAGHELPPVDKATVAGDFSTTGRSTNADPPELALAAKAATRRRAAPRRFVLSVAS